MSPGSKGRIVFIIIVLGLVIYAWVSGNWNPLNFLLPTN